MRRYSGSHGQGAVVIHPGAHEPFDFGCLLRTSSMFGVLFAGFLAGLFGEFVFFALFLVSGPRVLRVCLLLLRLLLLWDWNVVGVR